MGTASIAALGELTLQQSNLLALFYSVPCPGSLISRACDLAVALRAASVPVVRGFHSPIEQECLRCCLRRMRGPGVCRC